MHILDSECFAERVRERTFEIVIGFLRLSRDLIPHASEASTHFLKDHVPQQIEAFSNFFAKGGERKEREVVSILAQMHGIQRAADVNYTASLIRHEHAILRNLLISLLKENETMSQRMIGIFTDLMELNLGETVAAFAFTKGNRDGSPRLLEIKNP